MSEQRFGVFDRFGREIGARAHTFETTYTQVEEGDETGPQWIWDNPGLFYCFKPDATRGGESYGATHRTQHYSSREERDAAVARYFVDARKRAEKTAAAK